MSFVVIKTAKCGVRVIRYYDSKRYSVDIYQANGCGMNGRWHSRQDFTNRKEAMRLFTTLKYKYENTP